MKSTEPRVARWRIKIDNLYTANPFLRFPKKLLSPNQNEAMGKKKNDLARKLSRRRSSLSSIVNIYLYQSAEELFFEMSVVPESFFIGTHSKSPQEKKEKSLFFFFSRFRWVEEKIRRKTGEILIFLHFILQLKEMEKRGKNKNDKCFVLKTVCRIDLRMENNIFGGNNNVTFLLKWINAPL